jgi:hypothetical protein
MARSASAAAQTRAQAQRAANMAKRLRNIWGRMGKGRGKSEPPGCEEFSGGPQIYSPDLSHVTGRGAQSRNRAIDSIIREDFRSLNLTHQPQYNPFIRTGVAQKGAGTQIGKMNFSSRADLRNVIVHEELHHRWWARGIFDHHPAGSAKEFRFYETIRRYERMRGWAE